MKLNDSDDILAIAPHGSQVTAAVMADGIGLVFHA